MDYAIAKPFVPLVWLEPAHESRLPILLDSPHSGVEYPPDFLYAVDFGLLRRAEDTYVDHLYGDAPTYGATLLAARFPRSYIDCNRALEDFDAELIEDRWLGPINPSSKTRLGKGLVWRLLDGGEAIYARKLSAEEVRRRIVICYQPYWAALRERARALLNEFGALWHLNCHSMPSVAQAYTTETPGVRHADFVLGDRCGTTCDPQFTALIADTLRGFGYEVKLNDPYQGVEIVRALGDPASGVSSLQIEINRALYMDEETLVPHDGYATLHSHIRQLLGVVVAFARERSAVGQS